MRKSTWLITTCMILLRCSPADTTESTALAEHSVRDDAPSPARPEGKTVQKASPDSLIVDLHIYEDTARILSAGQFHDQEVWPEAASEEWFGIFHGINGYYLEKSALKVVRVRDDLLDMEGEATGWHVSSTHPDEPLLFISGLSFLMAKSLQPIDPARGEIFPGDTVAFNYAGVEYAIHATGTDNPNVEERSYSIASDYKLYLTAKRNGTTTRQLLLEIEDFDSEMIDILFAGDIDSDEVPDLIINTSRHYNVRNPTLYLSRPAASGSVLKAMGDHRTVGC